MTFQDGGDMIQRIVNEIFPFQLPTPFDFY